MVAMLAVVPAKRAVAVEAAVKVGTRAVAAWAATALVAVQPVAEREGVATRAVWTAGRPVARATGRARGRAASACRMLQQMKGKSRPLPKVARTAFYFHCRGNLLDHRYRYRYRTLYRTTSRMNIPGSWYDHQVQYGTDPIVSANDAEHRSLPAHAAVLATIIAGASMGCSGSKGSEVYASASPGEGNAPKMARASGDEPTEGQPLPVLTAARLGRVKEIFSAWDIDSKGMLELQAFAGATIKVGPHESHILAKLQEMDVNGDGFVETSVRARSTMPYANRCAAAVPTGAPAGVLPAVVVPCGLRGNTRRTVRRNGRPTSPRSPFTLPTTSLTAR